MDKIKYPKDLPQDQINHIEHLREENIKKMTEGEEFIQLYLEEKSIKYILQYPLFLKGDSKHYRLADFYLPEYDVFIEFFGQYNTPEGKERYKEKKELYWRNGINCIYTYPENLGFLDFLFKRRLLEALKKERRFWPLLRYTGYILILDSLKWVLVIAAILLYLLIFQASTLIDRIVFGLFSAFALGSIIARIIDVWKK